MITELIGHSLVIQDVKNLIKKVAKTNTTVLILGESGTGKELVAQIIHQCSDRHGTPFVPVNCGAIPYELLESELFGHEKGSFTGAIASRVGRFELAREGTIFLDEIGDMPVGMQVKLLRVLQDGYFEKIGSSKNMQSNARVIAATNRNLEDRMRTGHFREDLYYRLNVFPIYMPPLRERKEDIAVLIDYFMNKNQLNGQGFSLSLEVNQRLMEYAWPGNIRELSNLIERLSILYPGQEIQSSDLPVNYVLDEGRFLEKTEVVLNANARLSGHQGFSKDFDLKKILINIELNYIEQALHQTGGNVSKSAKLLGLRRTTLIEKIKKLGIVHKLKDVG